MSCIVIVSEISEISDKNEIVRYGYMSQISGYCSPALLFSFAFPTSPFLPLPYSFQRHYVQKAK